MNRFCFLKANFNFGCQNFIPAIGGYNLIEENQSSTQYTQYRITKSTDINHTEEFKCNFGNKLSLRPAKT